MFTKKLTGSLAAGLIILALIAWFQQSPPTESRTEVALTTERVRGELELRDGLLFEKEAETPFNGLLVENYPTMQRKLAIEIREGKSNGTSRGWYENGQLEVTETFVDGVAEGPRTRWYENGNKRSEALLEKGKVIGTFVQWHPNGQKAGEATLLDGSPDGLSQGWHPSGVLKSRVEFRGGEIVSREYWEDEAH